MPRALLALAATAAAALPVYAGPLSASAGAAPTSEQASLHASFTPDRLEASTTIAFGFHLQTTTGLAPPPLTSVVMHMPAGMNYTLTTLGLAVCQPAALQAQGLKGCSPNSRVGSGSALVEVPFGTGSGHEIPEIQAVVGPSTPDGDMVVLFYANGQFPVSAQLVFSGEVQPDHGVFGSQLATTVPLIPSVPNGPDVSIVDVNATIGPAGLTYYHHVHGRLRPFHPLGIGVPERCPRGGFPFSASFVFQDGSTASASTAVPCPPRVKRHKK
ncbi:MAG TPA: hypothetical protein VG053_02360 [Solirubrobacteraceae bacterium]|jgi:hypothetical protein|nr:hypothetical protein [Solirubrobacteraceae bacterium]